MTALIHLVDRYGPTTRQRPWPRVTVDEAAWASAAEQLAASRWSLLGLWGDDACVHAAVRDAADFAVLSLPCDRGGFPSLGRHHPPAIRLERAVRDLFGFEPRGLADLRPWLDHGRWEPGSPHPVGAPARPVGANLFATGSTAPPHTPAPPYRFLPTEGESLHEIPVGPVHAGIIEPGHFRFTASGETVVRLEARLGYVHKGIEGLLAGCDLGRGATLAGRCSGDSSVAYALAFARAAEAATGTEVPPRAHWLRALMAELERLANHLGDIGAICNDAAFALLHTHCGILREKVLRAADACFGHRLMFDQVRPGGIARDIHARCGPTIRALVDTVRQRFPALVELYDNTASLQDRTVGTGVLKHGLAQQFAAGGYIGRASGRDFDARRTPGYPPYDALEFVIPVLDEGDVNARVWIRIREVEQSLALVEQILDGLPSGAVRNDVPAREGEGIALVEGFRGDVLVWLSLARDGTVRRCHLRDPSWFQWPLLEAVIEGNIVADFPLCNKSFNCSYSGHDL